MPCGNLFNKRVLKVHLISRHCACARHSNILPLRNMQARPDVQQTTQRPTLTMRITGAALNLCRACPVHQSGHGAKHRRVREVFKESDIYLVSNRKGAEERGRVVPGSRA